jgi:glucose-6-phosphate 1-epimerase
MNLSISSKLRRRYKAGMNDSPSIPGLRAGEFQGLPALLIDTPQSKCAISLFGAHVLSFTPKGFSDLLWMSPTNKKPPSPIRGGVPLCWPHFAKQGQPDTAPQHGSARTQQWKVSLAQQMPSGEIELALVPADAHYHALSVMLTMRIGASLSQALTTVNTTDIPFTLTQAFHTYFRVGDARTVSVKGLAGKKYLDKFDGFNEHAQTGDFRLEAKSGLCSDRIYQKVAGEYVMVDPSLKRTIHLRSTGSNTLVVWNPGAEVVKTFTDIPHDAWPDYFCLEVANAGEEVITLGPGESKQISQTIFAENL